MHTIESCPACFVGTPCRAVFLLSACGRGGGGQNVLGGCREHFIEKHLLLLER